MTNTIPWRENHTKVYADNSTRHKMKHCKYLVEENGGILIASPICNINNLLHYSEKHLTIWYIKDYDSSHGKSQMRIKLLTIFPCLKYWREEEKKGAIVTYTKLLCLLSEGVKPYANILRWQHLFPGKPGATVLEQPEPWTQFFFIKTAMPLSWLEVLVNPRSRSPFCKNCITQ